MDPDASVVDAVFDAFRLGVRRSACTGGSASGALKKTRLRLQIDERYLFGRVKRRERSEPIYVYRNDDGTIFEMTRTDHRGKPVRVDGITLAAEDIMQHIKGEEKWLNELHIGSKLVAKRNPDRRRVDLLEQHGWEAYNDQRRRLLGGDQVVIDRIEDAIRALWSEYEADFTRVLPIHLTIGLDMCLQERIEEIENFFYAFFYKPRFNADYSVGTPTPIEEDSYRYGYFYGIMRNTYGLDDPGFREEVDNAVERYQEDLDEAALVEFMSRMYRPDAGLRDDIAHALKTQLGKTTPGTKPTVVSSGVEGDDYAVLKERKGKYVRQARGIELTYPDWSPEDRTLDGALGTDIQRYFVEAALRDDGKRIRISFECPCPT